MTTTTITRTEYQTLIRQQKRIATQVDFIVKKLDTIDFLREFEQLSQWGKAFAKKKKIKLQDVLKNVSGDKHLLSLQHYKHLPIISPRDFVGHLS